MKCRWPFIVCGVLSVLVSLGSVQRLRPRRSHPDHEVAISFLGYTNQGNTVMAAFQVTNRTAATYMCFIGPRASEASHGGRPDFHDLYPAAAPGRLNPLATFTFFVPAAPDTDRWRVSVELQEMPGTPSLITAALRWIGLPGPKGHDHYLTSPPFSRPGG